MSPSAWIWSPSSYAPLLATHEVHVWRVDLDVAPGDASRLEPLLDERERAQRARLVGEHRGARYLVSHGALRQILGGYAGHPPESLLFRTSSGGKPELALPDSGLHFSLSHSGGQARIAVAKTPVGVDLEMKRPFPPALMRDPTLLSAREREALLAEPGARRPDTFVRLWTKKEAYLKALGSGIRRSLAEIDVLDPTPRVEGRPDPAWRVDELEPRAGSREDAVFSAVAVPAGTTPPLTLRWTG